MIEIDRVCRENNIKYFLSSGSLLGAIRHKGFIPWDDDMDVMMTYGEYKRFLKIAPKKLGEKFFLQCNYTDNWYQPFSKVRMNGTTAIEKSYDGVNFHQGVWVDIFPVVGVEEDAQWREKRDSIVEKRNLLLQDAFFDKTGELTPKTKLIKALPLGFRRFIVKLIDKYVYKDYDECSGLCGTVWGFKLRAYHESRFFNETTDVNFEGYKFSAPKLWDEYLTSVYGDYMTPPPEDKRNSGHFLKVVDLENDYKEYL